MDHASHPGGGCLLDLGAMRAAEIGDGVENKTRCRAARDGGQWIAARRQIVPHVVEGTEMGGHQHDTTPLPERVVEHRPAS